MEQTITSAGGGGPCIKTQKVIQIRQQERPVRTSSVSSGSRKQTAELVGFEVVGRITLRDKETGREYR